MNKSEVLELKKRFTKNGCTFTKMSGCYVNAQKEMQLLFHETFLNLEEEEFYKYLEIAKKALSGAMGNNLLEISFPATEEQAGGRQQFLMGLRASKLKNEALLETFFQQVIENYSYVGNYLILLFHDAYDVMTKTTDHASLDESEEVYEYLLCAICPVDLTKPGLGYLQDENRIGARFRDWVVQVPESGFLFPAFSDRSADIHAALVYTKNTAEPHRELAEVVLGCQSKQTATQQKKVFEKIVTSALAEEESGMAMFGEIQESLSLMVEEQLVEDELEKKEIILTKDSVTELLEDAKLPAEISIKIANAYEKAFGEELPVVDHLIDKKVLAENEKRKVEKVLAEKVSELQEKLKLSESSEYDVVLKVKPEKARQIRAELIDGKNCIVIPLEDEERYTVSEVRPAVVS